MTEDKVIKAPFNGNTNEASGSGDRSKPCIALMGEFSAGKTTLINFLIGKDVLPTKVTATQVPPVWMSYGDGEPYYVDSDHQQHPLKLTDIQGLPVDEVRYIKIFSDSEILESFDMIDTPGISDPNIPEFHRDTAIDNADAVIWCTHATQAWRASEKSTWDEMPEKLHRHSILLATRADKLDENNRERVKKRLMRETGDVFGSIIMFSATDALKAKAGEGPDGLLEQSGGVELLEALQRITDELSDTKTAEEPAEATTATPLRPVRPARVARASEASTAPAEAEPADAANVNAGESGADEATPQGSAAFVLDQGYRYDDSEAAPEPAPADEQDEAENAAAIQSVDEPRKDGDEWFDTQSVKDIAEPDEYYDDDSGDAIDESVLTQMTSRAESTEAADAVDEVAQALADVERPATGEQTETDMGTARALWEQILAEQEVETVADVLKAVGRFIDVMDQHGAFSEIYIRATSASAGEDEDSGWRLTS